MKVLSEIQEKSSEITQRDKTLLQLRAASEEHQLQQTRLQATIAQQGKLIDYLQGMGSSPGESRGIGRIKKVREDYEVNDLVPPPPPKMNSDLQILY